MVECSLLADGPAHKVKKWFLTIARTLLCQEWQLSSEHYCGWWKLVSSLWSRNETTEHGIASQNHPWKSQKQFPVPVEPWELSGCKGAHIGWVLPWRETINAACNLQVLQKLCCALCYKCPGKRKIILLHKNTCLHTAVCGADSEELLGCSPHPPYSLDQGPSNYHLFRFVKDKMWDQYCGTSEAVQEAICCCLWIPKTEFYYKEIFQIFRTVAKMHW